MGKYIDKNYLIEQLKGFDKNILESKYIQTIKVSPSSDNALVNTDSGLFVKTPINNCIYLEDDTDNLIYKISISNSVIKVEQAVGNVTANNITLMDDTTNELHLLSLHNGNLIIN